MASEPAATVIRVTLPRPENSQPEKTVQRFPKLGAVIVLESPCNTVLKVNGGRSPSTLTEARRFSDRIFSREAALKKYKSRSEDSVWIVVVHV